MDTIRTLVNAVWTFVKFIWSSVIVAFIVQLAATLASPDPGQFFSNMKAFMDVLNTYAPWIRPALAFFLIFSIVLGLLVGLLKEEKKPVDVRVVQ